MVAACILFFTVIVYVRLDFSITKVPDACVARLPCVRLGRLAVAGAPPPPTRWHRPSLTLEALLLLLAAKRVGLRGQGAARGECRGVGGGGAPQPRAPRRGRRSGATGGRSDVQTAGPWF